MSFEEANEYLDDCLTAVIECKRLSEEAQKYAEQAELHMKETQHWRDKLKRKGLLFKED